MRFPGILTARGGPRLVGAALLSSLAVLGCGDGESSAISKAEFVREASAICERTRNRIQSEFAAYGESREGREAVRAERAGELTYGEEATRVARRIVIPAMQSQFDELRALGVPAEGGAGARALLAAFGSGVEKAEAHPERATQDGTEAFGEQERLADEYGLEGC